MSLYTPNGFLKSLLPKYGGHEPCKILHSINDSTSITLKNAFNFLSGTNIKPFLSILAMTTFVFFIFVFFDVSNNRLCIISGTDANPLEPLPNEKRK